jgi:hypothetical protein
MKKRGRRQMRSTQYSRAYYTRKQREWRAAHPRHRRRRKQKIVDWPSLPTYEESLFLHQNDYWAIRYHDHTALLKSTRGLHCLALLLRYPGREFHVSELLASFIAAPTRPPEVIRNRRLRDARDQMITAGVSDAGPVLDAQAKAECKRRLSELRQALNEAEQFNDPDRASNSTRDQRDCPALGLRNRTCRQRSQDFLRSRARPFRSHQTHQESHPKNRRGNPVAGTSPVREDQGWIFLFLQSAPGSPGRLEISNMLASCHANIFSSFRIGDAKCPTVTRNVPP